MSSIRSLIVLCFLFSSLSSSAYATFRFSYGLASAPPLISTTALNLAPQENGFNFNLTDNLPRASSTLVTLDTLPSSCADVNKPTGECTATMTATNVTFDDCGDPWTVCMCSNTNMTLDTVIDRFARVPVGLRRYVGTVLVSADNATHAYTLTNGDIHMFGDPQMETWLHESTHSFDYASGVPYSNSSEWLDAIGNDTCAPDNYSLTNAIEDFAQVSVVKIYALSHSGSLPSGWAPDCMKNQLQFMDSLPLYNATTLFGNTCAIMDDFNANNGARHVIPPPLLNMTKTFPLPDAPVEYYTTGSSLPSGFLRKPMLTVPVSTPTPTSTGKPNSALPGVYPRPISAIVAAVALRFLW